MRHSRAEPRHEHERPRRSCGCNGVCKGTIVKAINEQGLFTIDDVKKQTKAAIPAVPARAWSNRS